jgi:hypothetical protein
MKGQRGIFSLLHGAPSTSSFLGFAEYEKMEIAKCRG